MARSSTLSGKTTNLDINVKSLNYCMSATDSFIFLIIAWAQGIISQAGLGLTSISLKLRSKKHIPNLLHLRGIQLFQAGNISQLQSHSAWRGVGGSQPSHHRVTPCWPCCPQWLTPPRPCPAPVGLGASTSPPSRRPGPGHPTGGGNR